MKKITLSLLAALAFSFTANAQTPDVKIGVKGGLNIATLTGEGSSSLTGFNIGGVAEIFVNEKFSVQPEILYSTQGAEYSIFKKDIKAELHYINVPVMAKYYVYEGLNIQAGPQFGFNVKSELDGKDIKDMTKGFDFGLNLGLGYELPVGVFFDARYNFGLTDTFKSQAGVKSDTKNSVFQISVGYKF
ncbi:porin family protein [Myroides phaeus]|uniref:Outer membrane protein beta-barrel domain-containing protein n=1 Tax=Myroides phaeus TaxID=702745 RepID=A0A1G8D1F4_9FLAO|nr:porin family protein [Myroides phaeus]SDH51209.1 Outer membrane protein beta-barrel domain-containing protein [Myroides phaeus]